MSDNSCAASRVYIIRTKTEYKIPVSFNEWRNICGDINHRK